MGLSVTRYEHRHRLVAQTLPRLLEKVLQTGARAVVVVPSAHVEILDAQLWTYTPLGFLPHGRRGTGMPEDQPIWLTDTIENPNNATVLVLYNVPVTGGLEHGFERCLDIVEMDNPASQARAQERNNVYETYQCPLTIWADESNGSWKQTSTYM